MLLLSLSLIVCSPGPAAEDQPTTGAEQWSRQAERDAMVERQIAARGIKQPLVLSAMRQVPRHEFVPASLRDQAYADHPLPIGQGQTISQPYIVALMTELASLQKGDRVLEVGTGSGYQAAVLAAMGCQVFSIEILEALANTAASRLADLGYDAVHVRAGDGYGGWPDEAPFDAILITAAAPHVPEPLVEQLAPGGRLVVPVGDAFQELILLEKKASGLTRRSVLPVRFVPMTGEVRQRPEKEKKER